MGKSCWRSAVSRWHFLVAAIAFARSHVRPENLRLYVRRYLQSRQSQRSPLIFAGTAKWNTQRRKECVAFDAILRPELPVAAQVEISRLTAERENVPDLGTDGRDARLERPDPVTAAAIAAQLVIHIANNAQFPVC